MKKIYALLLSVALIFTLPITAFAGSAEAATTNDIQIVAKSLSLKDNVRVNFKVSVSEGITKDNVRLLVWEGAAADTHYTKDTPGATLLTPGGVDKNGYLVFQYCDVSAKEMGKSLYARAYIEMEGEILYSAPTRYSVVQYLDAQCKKDTNTEELKNLLTSIRQYGAMAQAYFATQGEETGISVEEPLYTVSVSGGTLADGFTKGTFLKGEMITLIGTPIAEKSFLHWRDSVGNIVGRTETLTVSANGDETYTAVYGSPMGYTEGLSFIYDAEDDSFMVSDYAGTDPNVIIPAQYRDDDGNYAFVTKIGDNAFKDCTHVETVALPLYVESIGNYAFYNCNALTAITLPEYVTNIGDYAFKKSNLSKIIIPDSVAKIGASAFSECINLTAVVFGENSKLTFISAFTFYYCENLSSFSIPVGVTGIDRYAFSNTALTEITIPKKVKYIGAYAFNGCEKLKNVNLEVKQTWDYSTSSDRNFFKEGVIQSATYLKSSAAVATCLTDTFCRYYWHLR